MKLINYYKKIKFLSSTRIVKNIVPILVSAIAGALCACVLTFCPSMSNMQNNFQMYENSQKKVLKKKGEINSFEQGVKTKTATETKTAQFSQLYGQGGYETPAKNQSIASLHDQTDAALLADAEMNESLEERTYSSLSYHVYRIKKGDMLGVIAEQFGITEDTLISVNNIKQSRLIQIGQYIKIPSIAGILYTVRNAGETAKNIAEKYEVNYEKLSAVNNIKADEKLTAGEVVFVPDAFLDWVTRQEINGDLFIKPLRSMYFCSSPYGWRNSPFTGKRSFHAGIDMACNKGTPVYPALAGTVTTAGWSTVYGNYVIVTHHSGYKTLYGHMSNIKAWRGRWVSTDTCLGYVGNTGMSTGPHLHFSIFKNGVSINPVKLWK